MFAAPPRARTRAASVTVAPEAGSERMRRVINKNLTEAEILRAAEWLVGGGVDALKLYVMVGLPTETAADVDGIVSMLTEEAAFPMPPLLSWYQGRAAIRAFLLATSLAGEAVGRWRLLPIHANGLPGFAFYLWEEKTGKYLPFALQVLSFAGELLSDVITFGYPGLFPAFNLQASLAE